MYLFIYLFILYLLSYIYNKKKEKVYGSFLYFILYVFVWLKSMVVFIY